MVELRASDELAPAARPRGPWYSPAIDATTTAYLARLGLEPEPPGLAALTRLHVRHLERVPFENLDIHRGVEIRLDQDALVAKIVGGRGGFCYELNAAFAWLLARLGYAVTLLEARVAAPDGGFGIRFDHMALRVDLERSYLADVGFGESFVEPISLADGARSTQRGHEYALRRDEDGLILERRPLEGAWEPQFRLALAPRRLADFEPGCRHHQSSPDSHFTKGPICTRLDGDARVTLHESRLTRAGRTTPVDSEAEWRALLAKWFGIVL